MSDAAIPEMPAEVVTGGTGASAVTGGTGGGTAPQTGGTGMANAGSADASVVGDGGPGADPGPSGPVALPDDGNALSVCSSSDDCNGDDLLCAVFGNFRGYCAEDCKTEDDCAAIGGIAPSCDSTGRCVIDCKGGGEGDGECPMNMECAEIMTNPFAAAQYRCQYPEAKDGGIYEKCDALRNDSDCMDGLTCSVFVGLPLLSEITTPYCAASCKQADECDSQGSKAKAVCDLSNPLSADGLCALECTNDKQCPGEMLCRTLDLVRRRCGYAL